MSNTKRYKVCLNLLSKDLGSRESNPRPVEEAGASFFMDVKHDAAGKPLAGPGDVTISGYEEYSKFASAKLTGEFKALDAQNVRSHFCVLVRGSEDV